MSALLLLYAWLFAGMALMVVGIAGVWAGLVTNFFQAVPLASMFIVAGALIIFFFHDIGFPLAPWRARELLEEE